MISRRALFGGSAALLAAPSIVRVASIMPLSVRRPDMPLWYSGIETSYGWSPAQGMPDMATVNATMARTLGKSRLHAQYMLAMIERQINPPVILDGDKLRNIFTGEQIGRVPASWA